MTLYISLWTANKCCFPGHICWHCCTAKIATDSFTTAFLSCKLNPMQQLFVMALLPAKVQADIFQVFAGELCMSGLSLLTVCLSNFFTHDIPALMPVIQYLLLRYHHCHLVVQNTSSICVLQLTQHLSPQVHIKLIVTADSRQLVLQTATKHWQCLYPGVVLLVPTLATLCI